MWQAIRLPDQAPEQLTFKWAKVNEQGRIVARILLKGGEYKASKVVFDAEGLGTKDYLGSFFSLDQAKAAVDAGAP